MKVVERENARDISIEPGDEGQIISFPDQPGGDLEIIAVGDAAAEQKWDGFPAGGISSTLTAPVLTTVRQANLDVIPAGIQFNTDDPGDGTGSEMAKHLAERRWIHTLQPDGSNKAQDVPEAGWVDPRTVAA